MIHMDKMFWKHLLETKLTVPCFCQKWQIMVHMETKNRIQLTEYGILHAERWIAVTHEFFQNSGIAVYWNFSVHSDSANAPPAGSRGCGTHTADESCRRKLQKENQLIHRVVGSQLLLSSLRARYSRSSCSFFFLLLVSVFSLLYVFSF